MNALLPIALSALMVLGFGAVSAATVAEPPAPSLGHHGEMGFSLPLPSLMGHIGGPMPSDTRGLVMLAEKLELTVDQRNSLGKLMDESTPKKRELMFQLADTHKEMRVLMEQDAVKEDKLRMLADQQGRLHADLLFNGLLTRSRMLALLTAEQRARLDEHKSLGPAHGGFGPPHRSRHRH